jgi:hypothetical protein
MDQPNTLFMLFAYPLTLTFVALALLNLHDRSKRAREETLEQLYNLEVHIYSIVQDVQHIRRNLDDAPQQISQLSTQRRAHPVAQRNAAYILERVLPRLHIEPAHLHDALQPDSQTSSNDHANPPQNLTPDHDAQTSPVTHNNCNETSSPSPSQTAPRDAAFLPNGDADVEPTSSESWNWNEVSEEDADGLAELEEERARERRNAELF